MIIMGTRLKSSEVDKNQNILDLLTQIMNEHRMMYNRIKEAFNKNSASADEVSLANIAFLEAQLELAKFSR